MSVEKYGIGIMLVLFPVGSDLWPGTGQHVEAGCIINLPAKSSAALPTGNKICIYTENISCMMIQKSI